MGQSISKVFNLWMQELFIQGEAAECNLHSVLATLTAS